MDKYNLYMISVLVIIALIAIGILLFNKPIESFSNVCTGNGITWFNYYLYLNSTDELNIEAYNKKLSLRYEEITNNTSDQKYGMKSLSSIDELVSRAELFIKQNQVINTSYLPTPPTGFIITEFTDPISYVAHFVSQTLIQTSESTPIFTETTQYKYYKYYPCESTSRHIEQQYAHVPHLDYNPTTDNTNNLANVGVSLNYMMSINDAKILANTFSDCSGFILKTTGELADLDYTTCTDNPTLYAMTFLNTNFKYTITEMTQIPLVSSTTKYVGLKKIAFASQQLSQVADVSQSFSTSLQTKTFSDDKMRTSPLKSKVLDNRNVNYTYCKDKNSLNCCLKLGEKTTEPNNEGGYTPDVHGNAYTAVATSGNLDVDIPFPSINGILDTMDDTPPDATNTAFNTCPYFVDKNADIYARSRTADCCEYSPTNWIPLNELSDEKSQLRSGFPVTNDEMFKDNDINCNAQTMKFSQAGCNTLCSKKAQADPTFSARVRRTNGGYPTFYRRDLGKCVYDEDKCKYPTREACNSQYTDFPDMCPTEAVEACANEKATDSSEGTCNKNMTTNWTNSNPTQNIKNSFCTSNYGVKYTKVGNMNKDYNVQLSKLQGPETKVKIAYNKWNTLGPTVAFVQIWPIEKISGTNTFGRLITMPIEQYPPSSCTGGNDSDMTKSKSNANKLLTNISNTVGMLGTPPYYAIRYSDDISEITIQDANQNIFKADLRESC